MSTNNYRINQSRNVGLVIEGVHNGDKIFYDGGEVDRTPKHAALETHKAVKAEWESSGTCDWLLEERGFQLWEGMESEYSFLWLHGLPGYGKSTLMSRVIESIYTNQCGLRAPNTIHLLYFYVGHGDDRATDKLYRNMLLAFWQQASNHSDHRLIGDHSPPELIEKQLRNLLTSSKRDTYIVIDALDQLPLTAQYRLTCWFNALVQGLKDETGNCRLSAAISSRDLNGIDQLRAHKIHMIEVTAESNRYDIKRYIEKKIKTHSKLLNEKPELAKRVIRGLCEKADGMFLWANLQTLNICDMGEEPQVTNALQSLVPPQKIQDMYRTYAERIDNLGEPIQKQVAQRILPLLAHSTGSISKEAALVALSLDATGKVDQSLHRYLNRNHMAVVRFCNHLVHINDNLGVFQMCHGTVFEFFKNYKVATYNYRIAILCLSHLCSPEFSRGPQEEATWYSPGGLGPVLQQHPFLPYASSKWAPGIKKGFAAMAKEDPEAELKESSSKALDWLEILLDKDRVDYEKGNLQLSFQVHLISQGRAMPRRISHEHIVSYFSLVKILDTLDGRKWFDWEKLDDDGLRPIHWAIRNNVDSSDVEPTVSKLIDYGTDINVQDKGGHTPLYYAAYYGNSRVAQLLIKKNAKLDLMNKNKETALIAACKNHQEDVVLCLVKAGADVKLQSYLGTALQAISITGCCRCATAILGPYKNSKIVENCGPIGTSLHAAAVNGHSDLVKLLCTKRINIHATHKTYGTPITAAATAYNPGLDPTPYMEIVEELVKHGVNVNDRSGLLGPALRAAAYHGSSDLVRLLLDKGAKIKVNSPMGTFYKVIDDDGYEEIRRIYDAEAADYSGTSTKATQFRQIIQRRVFTATLKTSSMDTLNNLITQFEKFATKEILKGETPFLRALACLAKDAFQDVIELATESHGNPKTPVRAQNRRSRLLIRQLWHVLTNIWCIKSAGKSLRSTSEVSLHLYGSTNTFVEDSLKEHLPQVLDRMTQAGVKLLEDAIVSGDENTIRLFANTWVVALNKLVSSPGFGEPMLETVIQRRSDDLKGHLTDAKLSQEERFRKAEALALVGIELILTSVEHGHRFKHLTAIFSKLWVKAVADVEDLGKEGEIPVREFIRIFGERFSTAVERGDQVNAEVCGQAGVQLLKAAALNPKKRVLDKFSKEWGTLWGLAFGKNMDYMAKELINQPWKEYQRLRKDGKNSEALGFALAGIGMLRATIKFGTEHESSILQHFIESGFQLAQESYTRPSIPQHEQIPARDLEAILDGLVNLFATSEEVRPGCLSRLAYQVLDLTEAVFGDNYQRLNRTITDHIERANRIINPSEREEQLIRISRTTFIFFDLILAKEESPIVLSILRDVALGRLAKALPDLMDRDELVHYGRVIEYLKSESTKI